MFVERMIVPAYSRTVFPLQLMRKKYAVGPVNAVFCSKIFFEDMHLIYKEKALIMK